MFIVFNDLDAFSSFFSAMHLVHLFCVSNEAGNEPYLCFDLGLSVVVWKVSDQFFFYGRWEGLGSVFSAVSFSLIWLGAHAFRSKNHGSIPRVVFGIHWFRMLNYNFYLTIMAPQELQVLFILRYRVADTAYYLRRLEQNMRSRPTCWPTYIKQNHYDLRVRVYHMIHRYENILDGYALRFTSELSNHRLRYNGQYPEWEFCTCFERGGDVSLVLKQ